MFHQVHTNRLVCLTHKFSLDSPQVTDLLPMHLLDTLGHDLKMNDSSKYSTLTAFPPAERKSLAFLGVVWKQMILTQSFRSKSDPNSKSNSKSTP